LQMFINIDHIITFTETSIDETNKTQKKVRSSEFMFKMSTIHANTCIQTTTPLCNHCHDHSITNPLLYCGHDDGVVQQPPLAQQTFFGLLHIMDLRTVDPLMKDTPDAAVHRIQIWRIGWPHIKLLASLSLQHGDSVTRTVKGMISVTSTLRHQVRDVHGTQRSTLTSMISRPIHLQSCVPKIIKNTCIFVKVIVKKISGTFLCGHGVVSIEGE